MNPVTAIVCGRNSDGVDSNPVGRIWRILRRQCADEAVHGKRTARIICARAGLCLVGPVGVIESIGARWGLEGETADLPGITGMYYHLVMGYSRGKLKPECFASKPTRHGLNSMPDRLLSAA